MIARKILALLLTAISSTALIAQGTERTSRPRETTGASGAFFLQAPIPDAPLLKERPVLSKAVAVEDLGIRIPPPPLSVEVAAAGYRDIQNEAARALAFLKKEIEQLEKDQTSALTYLKDNPTLAQLGTDSDFFKALLALSRDPETAQARKAFLEAARQAQDSKEKADDTSGQLVGFMARSASQDAEDQSKAAEKFTPVITAWFMETRGSLDALSTNRLLSEYVRAWGDYSGAINRFVDRVADSLKVPEKELAPATMLLVRLLKTQVFRIYHLQIQEQVQIWAKASQVGARSNYRSYGWDADRH